LKIIPVKHLDDVLKIALSPDVVIEPPRPRRQRNEEQGEEPNEEEQVH